MINKIGKYFGLCVFFLIPLWSQGLKLPIDTQLELIPKIIAFDKNFNIRVNNQKKISIGIVYSSLVKNSFRIKEEILKIVRKQKSKVRNLEICYNFIEVDDYKKQTKENEFYAIYITPMRGVDISEILLDCKQKDILSITGLNEYYENGVSIFLDLINNSPKININLTAVQQEGINLSSYLLKLANIKK